MQRSCYHYSTCLTNPPHWLFHLVFSFTGAVTEARAHALYKMKKKDKLSRAFKHWYVLGFGEKVLSGGNFWIALGLWNPISHAAKWVALTRTLWRETKPQNNIWRGCLINSLQMGISQNPSGSTSHLWVQQIFFLLVETNSSKHL